VVDDNERIRGIIRRNLEHAGYAVVTACNGGAALRTASSAMADPLACITLVLTDIDMPGGGGIRLGQELAERWPKMPVIYMSGTSLGLCLRTQLPASANFIPKPFGAKTLLDKVEIVLSLGTADS
jgi:DNA-binding response OmpR family regulator